MLINSCKALVNAIELDGNAVKKVVKLSSYPATQKYAKSLIAALSNHTNLVEKKEDSVQSSHVKLDSVRLESLSTSIKKPKHQRHVSEVLGEETKREFFSIALSHKLSLSHGHPAINQCIQSLYAKAIRYKVPRDNWNEFIINEFESLN